jgi:uncharacterized damage-inducible protein DinB
MASKQELLSTYNQMESERQKLLTGLSQYSHEVLEKKPAADVWSVTEVIYQLVVAERGALSYLNKKLEVGGFHQASFSAGLKQKLLNFLISLPIKFKAPKVVQLPKDTHVTYEEVVTEWNGIRKNMKQTYEGLSDDFCGKELFKHPIAGKMNVVQGLKFMRQHMNRHIGQIERTLKQVA